MQDFTCQILCLLQVTRIGRPGKSPTDVALRCGMEDEANGTPDSLEYSDNSGFAGAGKKRVHHPECDDPSFTRSVMQERYPEIEVYHCDIEYVETDSLYHTLGWKTLQFLACAEYPTGLELPLFWRNLYEQHHPWIIGKQKRDCEKALGSKFLPIANRKAPEEGN